MGWWERQDEIEAEEREGVDPLWWGIAAMVGGLVWGVILMAAV